MPQGSIVGPLLSLCITCDQCHVIHKQHMHMHRDCLTDEQGHHVGGGESCGDHVGYVEDGGVMVLAKK